MFQSFIYGHPCYMLLKTLPWGNVGKLIKYSPKHRNLLLSGYVKIVKQCSEIFDGENVPNVPPWLRAWNNYFILSQLQTFFKATLWMQRKNSNWRLHVFCCMRCFAFRTCRWFGLVTYRHFNNRYPQMWRSPIHLHFILLENRFREFYTSSVMQIATKTIK